MTASEREHLDDLAEEFDTYYKEEKDALKRAIDRIFRKAMVERLNLTLEECKNINGKKILDVGCGTGLVAVQLAKRGARLIGIDTSQSTIDAMKLTVEKEGFSNRAEFIRDDFAKHPFNEKFAVSLALGTFDYTKDAEFHIKKMRSITTEKCIMSFSSKFAFQVPLRVIWLRSRKTPAYFYTKKELKRLLSPHFSHIKIKNISAGYFCVGSI